MENPTKVETAGFSVICRQTKLKTMLLIVLLWSGNALFAQQKNIIGTVIDSAMRAPVNGATVILMPERKIDVTDETGQFFFKSVSSTAHSIIISAVSYRKKCYSCQGLKMEHQ